MLNSLLLAIRFLFLVFSGHKQVALENIALRHQLARLHASEKPTTVARSRSIILDSAEETLDGLEICARIRSA
jgi:CheY-like chemotaxis protein